jgi:hypothetical protein
MGDFMLNRRLFLGGLCASVPLIALPGALRAQARPRLHAMVVGINTYTGRGPQGKVPDLEGCINDANDIARQVIRLDPDVRILGINNEPVTRARFFSAWQSMMSAARDGDTLLLTYSGHGGKAPEACPNNEEDHLDETLILTTFDVRQTADRAEHIIDDELAALWAAARARNLRVIFVADSCFSGSVYRRVELTDRGRYRTIRAYQLAAGGRPPVNCQATLQEDPPNLLFLAGSREDEVVPEMQLDGAWRGALSVAVARALEGGADADRNGIITGTELRAFVLNYVESLADSNQHPTVRWNDSTRSTTEDLMGAATRGPLITLRQQEATAAKTPSVVKTPSDTAQPQQPGPVRLQVRGLGPTDKARVASALTNASIVTEGEPTALIWDAAQQLVFNDQGQRIAERVDAARLQHVVDRRRLLDRIIQMSAGRSLGVTIHLRNDARPAPANVADATHRAGVELAVRVSGVADGHYYVVFNLTGNGEVELLDPGPVQARTEAHIQAKGNAIGPFPVKVQPPFGADHVVVVAGQGRLSQLVPAVVRGHGRFAAADLMEALDREAVAQPLQAGYKGIYSTQE